jgi:N-acetyl-anhydromuramyl-L-alanine amidase AmpD
MIYQGTARYPVTEIILHCADTRPDWMAGHPLTEKVAEIRRWHVQQRGWRDIGYHWVIGRDGAVAQGRRETEIGAHVEGHNRGTIGICLLGGYGAKADDPFEKNFTGAQAAATKRLVTEIGGRALIKKVSGHNDYAAKACPGFTVKGFFAAAWAHPPARG